MKQAIPDSARQYMVSLAQVRAARKARQAQETPKATIAAAAPAPIVFHSPSQLDDAIGVLIGVREVLIKMGHSNKGNTIVLIDRVLRRRASER